MKIIFDNNKKLDGMKSKVLNTRLAKKYGWYPKVKVRRRNFKNLFGFRKKL